MDNPKTPEAAGGLRLAHSEVESQRFGFRIHRGDAAEVDDKAIRAALLEHEPDIAIIRIPSEKQHQISRLDRTGFPYVVADTLVYYQVRLTDYTSKPLKNTDLDFAPGRPEDAPALRNMVREIFPGYTNHYFSNPLLDKAVMLGAFEDWAARYLDGNGRIVWIARRAGEPVAFATCASEGDECEGVLYGVRPSAAGRGIYGDLIRFTQSRFKEQGCKRMKVSTQTQNYAVQVVWNREGFVLYRSLVTIHINSLLAKSTVEKRTLDFAVSAEDIGNCGRYSGDTNPLHFDNGFARGIGFDGRIAHGLIVGSMISKYYGTEFPGPGTVFLGYSYRFFKPVYPDRGYKLTFSFPVADGKRGVYKSLARLADEDDTLCLLAYSDLYKKP